MSDEERKAQPEHRSEWDLTLSVDGEGVVRVDASTDKLVVTPRELGLILTALLKGVLAGEGDDVQTVSLN